MNFISFIIKFIKFKPIIEFKKFERHNYGNLQGCPKLRNRSQPLVEVRHIVGHVEEILLLNKFFFRLSIRAL